MSTEAQKRASKKYYQSHKDYYREKVKESFKRVRQERWEYKRRNERAIEFIELNYFKVGKIRELLDILQGESDK